MANEAAAAAPTRKRKKAVSVDNNKGLRIEIFNPNDPKLEPLGKFLQELNKIGKKSSFSGKIVVGKKKKA